MTTIIPLNNFKMALIVLLILCTSCKRKLGKHHASSNGSGLDSLEASFGNMPVNPEAGMEETPLNHSIYGNLPASTSTTSFEQLLRAMHHSPSSNSSRSNPWEALYNEEKGINSGTDVLSKIEMIPKNRYKLAMKNFLAAARPFLTLAKNQVEELDELIKPNVDAFFSSMDSLKNKENDSE